MRALSSRSSKRCDAMSHWPGIRRIFRLDRGDVERNVDDELQFHFDAKLADLARRGLSPTEARAEAERQFGDVAGTRRRLASIDRSREGREQRLEWFGNIVQDARFAARGLRLRPGFATAAIVTLALGIGANVTMFGVVDRLLFRPPPFLESPGDVSRVYPSAIRRTLDRRCRRWRISASLTSIGRQRSRRALPYSTTRSRSAPANRYVRRRSRR